VPSGRMRMAFVIRSSQTRGAELVMRASTRARADVGAFAYVYGAHSHTDLVVAMAHPVTRELTGGHRRRPENTFAVPNPSTGQVDDAHAAGRREKPRTGLSPQASSCSSGGTSRGSCCAGPSQPGPSKRRIAVGGRQIGDGPSHLELAERARPTAVDSRRLGCQEPQSSSPGAADTIISGVTALLTLTSTIIELAEAVLDAPRPHLIDSRQGGFNGSRLAEARHRCRA
jgi:hypothetical protein